jgi:hypothetical protein
VAAVLGLILLLPSSLFSSQDDSFAQFMNSDLEVILIGFSLEVRLLGCIGTCPRCSFAQIRIRLKIPSKSRFGRKPHLDTKFCDFDDEALVFWP